MFIQYLSQERGIDETVLRMCQEFSAGTSTRILDTCSVQNNVFLGMVSEKLSALAILKAYDDACEIKYFAVSPDMERRDLGSKLLGYCEDWAWLKGYEEISCETSEVSWEFFDKNTYLFDGDFFQKDGVSHIRMKKELKERYESDVFNQISLLELYHLILDFCHNFEEILLRFNEKQYPYMLASLFSRYVIDVYRHEKKRDPKGPMGDDLRKISALLHILIQHKDTSVRSWAVVGILESIQSLLRDQEEDFFPATLTRETRAWWNGLIKFWNKEIPYVQPVL